MRRMPFLVAFVVWTVVVWGNRLNNIWGDDDLSVWARLGTSLLAVSFLAGAGVAIWLALRGERRPLLRVVVALAGWTTVVWVVRGTGILVGDRSLGFKAVHVVLALVSIVLAVAAFRETRRRSRVTFAGQARAR